jgi:hypothetical protein
MSLQQLIFIFKYLFIKYITKELIKNRKNLNRAFTT